MSFTELTESRVEHVECHSVALFRARDCDQALVAVVLGLVDLDDTTADLTDFVDLLTTLTNDGTDHIVGDEDLLSQRSASHATMHRWSVRRRSVMLGTGGVRRLVRWHMGRRTISTGLRSVVHGNVGAGLGSSSVRVVLVRVRLGGRLLGTRIGASSVVLTLTEVAASGLRGVWDHLHTTRDDGSRPTASRGISRGRGAAETFVKLLEKSAAYIVSRDMNSIGYTHDHEGTLAGER